MKRKGARVYAADVDNLLGPWYDSTARRPLRGWTAVPQYLGSSCSGSDLQLPPSSSSAGSGADEEPGDPLLTTGDDGSTGGMADETETGAPLPFRVRQRRRAEKKANKGRGRGKALDVRSSFKDILVVLFCRQMAEALDLRDGGDPRSERLLRWTVARLRAKRAGYKHLTQQVLSTKAWSLRRSGCIGAVVRFKDEGALDNTARDDSIAFEVSLSAADQVVVCCSRRAEDCIGSGCAYQSTVIAALEEVVECSQMSMVDVLGMLCEDLRVSAMNQGIAVLYRKCLCVVRREGGSWPFAVVRRKKNGMWLCHACTQSPSSCTHAMAARDAGDNDQSEASGNEDVIQGLGRSGRRRGNLVYSNKERPLVPSQNRQAKHAEYLKAAKNGKVVDIPAPLRCLACDGLLPSNVPLNVLQGVIQFGTGSVESAVTTWWCHRCRRTCVIDGLEHGLVLSTQFTAYTEVFRFEAAVNLCRNASSLTSTYDLRSSFHQLSKSTPSPSLWTTCGRCRSSALPCSCISTCSAWAFPTKSVHAPFACAPTAACGSSASTDSSWCLSCGTAPGSSASPSSSCPFIVPASWRRSSRTRPLHGPWGRS